MKAFTFRESKSSVFICASLFNTGTTLKNLLLWEQNGSKFFLLRVDTFLEGLGPPGKQTGSHKNYSGTSMARTPREP